MKLKHGIVGLALAGAVTLGASGPAAAQNRPAEPYYFTPKITYSHTMIDDFNGQATFKEFETTSGVYKGKDSTDNTYGGGVAAGYDFGAYSEYPIRLELEYLYRGRITGDYPTQVTMLDSSGQYMTSSYSMSATIQTVMLNAMLDFPTDTAFTPYIQAGLGGAYVNARVRSTFDGAIDHPSKSYYTDQAATTADNRYGVTHSYKGEQSDWNLAWNAGGGFAYQLTDTMALDLGYRYSSFGKADFGSSGYRLDGPVKNEDFDPNQPATGTPPKWTGGKNPQNIDGADLGGASSKAKMKLDAHEVILGLRFTGF